MYQYITFFLLAILAGFLFSITKASKVNIRRVLLFTANLMILVLFYNSYVQDLLIYMVYIAIVIYAYLLSTRIAAPDYLHIPTILLILIPLLLNKLHIDLTFDFWLFVGLSYVMFRNITLVMDIKHRAIESLNFFDYLNYVYFFPTLISGPIDRYNRFVQDFMEPQPAPALYVKAFNFLLAGLAFKFIVAAYLGRAIASIESWSMINVNVEYMYLYTGYLYFDFAGYSMMAVSLSYFFRIRTMENFDYPFLAKNIQDFWNRWHISLATWFRDYIFSPTYKFLLLSEHTKSRRLLCLNLASFLTFFLMGVWHGLELHFILYGVYHGLLFVFYNTYNTLYKKKVLSMLPDNSLQLSLYNLGLRLLILHAIFFGFFIFSGYSFG